MASAAAQIPMKRELKVSVVFNSLSFIFIAAAQIPMKRELKGHSGLWNIFM